MRSPTCRSRTLQPGRGFHSSRFRGKHRLPPSDDPLPPEARPSDPKSGERSYALGHLRIEGVAQAVSQYVDREDGDREEYAWEEDVMRIRDELHPAFRHDVAPGRDVGRQSDAEEGKDRLQ